MRRPLFPLGAAGLIVARLLSVSSGAASAGSPWTTACSPIIMYLPGALDDTEV